MEKRFVARRDRLRAGGGHIHTGEAFPAAELSPSLLGLGWVSEGRGTVPVDDSTHEAFAEGELADHEPADPAAVKAFKKAQREAETPAPAAAPEGGAPTTSAPKKTSKPKAKKTSKAK